MAKKTAKTGRSAAPRTRKTSTRSKSAATGAKSTGRRSGGGGRRYAVPDTHGKHLVIVESPTKAKTINKYLGEDYVVMASVGHVRDLPNKAPKGVKQQVPGVDLEHDFEPTYQVMPDKERTVADLRKAAKNAEGVWFATDLDREGEAIAWHLAQALNVPLEGARRVVFNAITRGEIQQAFAHPRSIDEKRVNAQQARRILDRIVGYQVSPFLWKKVAGGLSAGRVQSVATRLVVEREREIDAFIPEEFWRITGIFASDPARAAEFAAGWDKFLRGAEQPPTVRDQLAWLGERGCMRGELVEFGGKPFAATDHEQALRAAAALGFVLEERQTATDEKAKGPAREKVTLVGKLGSPPPYRIRSIETRRTTSRPPAPFITSSLQQAAANRLGFGLQRTMRIAQQLYEGIDIKGKEGQVGLITYMRTDSTHLSGDALNMARDYIGREWGKDYLPDKPNFYASSNKSAQEAHEAIRPTDASITPRRVRNDLTEDQFKLYRLIWERFLACQMTPAQWDSTTVLIENEAPQASDVGVFKVTGRRLVFDGFYKAAGLPQGDEAILPALERGQAVGPLRVDPSQHFTNPPPRYTEASLQKKLEEEGIGRPSTYAAIIQTIQDRKYVLQLGPKDRRLYATDLGKVVTAMLVEAFPRIMDVAYTREMEAELDKVEDEALDWVQMLHQFYGPFKQNLDVAQDQMTHAKAVMEPAPHTCPKCGAGTVYRFGRNGRFLSCSTYPDCDYAAPIDREGNPMRPELSDIVCPKCGGGMYKRTGRFGPFLGCENYPECDMILKLDPKKQTVVMPKSPPLQIDLPCPKCEAPLNMRSSKRGPWLSCSKFPKCRGRLGWSAVEPEKQKELEAALEKHEKENPVPTIRNTAGDPIGDGYAPHIEGGEADADDSATGYDAA